MRLVSARLNAGKGLKQLFNWSSYEARAGLFVCQETSRKQFHHCTGPLKLVQACIYSGNT